MTSPDELSNLREEPFSKVVEQFKKLINSCDALTFLIGAGCSKCAGLPLTRELTDRVLSGDELNCTSKQILNVIKEEFADADDSHIEDYLSEIVDLLAIADRRVERGVEDCAVSVGSNQYTAEQLRFAIDQIKRAIECAIRRQVSVDTHRDFINSVHKPTRVGRLADTRPVDYLILNYDTIIEDALAMEKVPYADGLYGGATGWWKPDTFDMVGLSVRVIKIHGSIDWRLFPGDSSPRRVSTSIQMPDDSDLPVLIWPSSTKYQETQLDPFAELLNRARKAMQPPSHSNAQRLLVVCGYSLGDSHINTEIEKALEESTGDLTVAVFTDVDEPIGTLKEWHESASLRENLLIFANKGFFHGGNKQQSQDDLPWWKFENLTRMLKGEV